MNKRVKKVILPNVAYVMELLNRKSIKVIK